MPEYPMLPSTGFSVLVGHSGALLFSIQMAKRFADRQDVSDLLLPSYTRYARPELEAMSGHRAFARRRLHDCL